MKHFLIKVCFFKNPFLSFQDIYRMKWQWNAPALEKPFKAFLF